MVRLALIAWLLFKGWMFFDAVKRRAPGRWFWIIPFVPGGAIAYLFAVKLRSPEVGMVKTRIREALRPSTTVADAQRDFDMTPSLLNRVRLGQALYDAEQYADALTRFGQALDERPRDKDALYGVALCRLELGDPGGAVEPLEKLIDAGKRYRDYAPWEHLAQALWESEQPDECLALLERLVVTSPRPRHYFMQAHYLERAGLCDEAQSARARGKEAEAQIPEHLRRGHRPWVVNARDIMRGSGGG